VDVEKRKPMMFPHDVRKGTRPMKLRTKTAYIKGQPGLRGNWPL